MQPEDQDFLDENEQLEGLILLDDAEPIGHDADQWYKEKDNSQGLENLPLKLHTIMEESNESESMQVNIELRANDIGQKDGIGSD